MHILLVFLRNFVYDIPVSHCQICLNTNWITAEDGSVGSAMALTRQHHLLENRYTNDHMYF